MFKEAGLPTLKGAVASNIDEAVSIAQKTGYPLVLKAQVLAGGRGKAGGIKVVRNETELRKAFPALRRLTIKGYGVEKIFIVRALSIKKEFYLGAAVDSAKDDVVLIASSAGGVDIEQTAQTNPKAIKKFYLQGNKTIDQRRWPEFIQAVFKDPAHQKTGTEIFQALVKFLFAKDCSLAEINPLVIDEQGQIYAADAKINFDDNALFRHEDIQKLRDLRYEEPDELKAKEEGLSFVKLDGNVGCIVNGAGLAMATMDIVKLLGGKPANFLDVGGSSNPQKVIAALRIILGNPHLKAILINIFGGITRCDDVANGILEAKKQLKFSVPLIVRLTGTNEDAAKTLLTKNGIKTYATMREAVQKAVELAK